MSDKFELILLVADLSAALYAAVKAGKISESDVINIECANGAYNKTIYELLDHANDSLGYFGYHPAKCEVKNG